MINCIIKTILCEHKFQRSPSKWQTTLKTIVNKGHVFLGDLSILSDPSPTPALSPSGSPRPPFPTSYAAVSIFTGAIHGSCLGKSQVTFRHWFFTGSQARQWWPPCREFQWGSAWDSFWLEITLCSTIYNNQDMETTEISINRGMDKEDGQGTYIQWNITQP